MLLLMWPLPRSEVRLRALDAHLERVRPRQRVRCLPSAPDVRCGQGFGQRKGHRSGGHGVQQEYVNAPLAFDGEWLVYIGSTPKMIDSVRDCPFRLRARQLVIQHVTQFLSELFVLMRKRRSPSSNKVCPIFVAPARRRLCARSLPMPSVSARTATRASATPGICRHSGNGFSK